MVVGCWRKTGNRVASRTRRDQKSIGELRGVVAHAWMCVLKMTNVVGTPAEGLEVRMRKAHRVLAGSCGVECVECVESSGTTRSSKEIPFITFECNHVC